MWYICISSDTCTAHREKKQLETNLAAFLLE